MESINITSLSWWGFILVSLIIIGAVVFYFIVFKQVLKQMAQLSSKGFNFIFMDRLVLVAMVSALILSFFSVNPVVHGITIIFGFFIFYPSVNQIIKGLLFLNESKVRKGKVVEVQGNRGVIRRIGWTSIDISSDGKSHLVPYTKIFNEGISLSDSSASSRLHHVLCIPMDEAVKLGDAAHLIKELFFTFPFINLHVLPQIAEESHQIKLIFALSNDLYLPGLINKLKKLGLETNIQK